MTPLEQDYRRIALFLTATAIAVGLVTTVVMATDVLLLIFLGLLFGVFLVKTSEVAGRFIPIGYGYRLALVTAVLLALVVGGSALFAGKIEDRLNGMSDQLDKSTTVIEGWLARHPSAKSAVQRVPFIGEILDSETSRTNAKTENSSKQRVRTSTDQNQGGQTTGEASMLVKSTAGRAFTALKKMLFTSLGMIVNTGMIFFVGVFLASNPSLYRDGTVRLFPLERRERIREVMSMMGDAMFSWLVGRFFTMFITGAGTGIALWLLGVPMPFTVGVITGLLTFIPNIGGLLALILAMLMAATQGPATVAWVVGAYALLQLIESNIITPLVQQHQTAIPPALLISFQVIMGTLTGFLGVMVATPLLAAAKVLVQEVWIKDTLGDTEK